MGENINMAIHKLTDKEWDEIWKDKLLRVELAKSSFFHFMAIYIAHQFELPPADFHADIVDAFDSVDDLNKYIAIEGFRGSAKSTLTEAFAIWSMLNGRHNFIVFVGNVADDAKMALANMRSEIEENIMLRADFDIQIEDDSKKKHGFREKWSESQITVKGCTMVAKSKDQKIRGRKFKTDRIDMIIADDLEDVKDAQTEEGRLKTRQWFFTEILPATKQGVLAGNVKVVMIGNKVHKDCLIEHLSKGNIVRVFKFGLFSKDANGNIVEDEEHITWKGLYPNMEAIAKEKEKVMLAGEDMGPVIWAREYLLIDYDSEDMVLKPSEIGYYDDEWLQRKPLSAGVGVDFAISEKQTADFTAMVKGMEVTDDAGERKLLIMKNNVEKRMGIVETIKTAVEINDIMPIGTKFYPEKVQYQESAIQIMERNGLKVERMSAVGDKKARITSACWYIKTKRVLFPKTGAEKVIASLVGFGTEKHDDTADACAYLILGMIKKKGGLLFG